MIDATQAVSPQFVILAAATGTTGNLRITGGSLTTTSDIRLGNGSAATVPASAGGTARLEQSGGAVTLTGGNMNIGFGDTAVGTYNLSGGTLAITAGTIFAVGNRGNGTVNQTGGSVFVRGPEALSAATGNTILNLGRNGAVSATNPGTASGSYTLSAGNVTVAQLRFGNNALGAATGSTNTFNLQGTGLLRTGAINLINTNATNTFNFTGGTLTATSFGLSLTNNGGILSPASLFFGNPTTPPPVATGGMDTGIAAQTSPIGTTTFTLANAYNQGPTGTLAIDIAAPGSNDFVDIGADPGSVVAASISGSIAVTLLGGFQPALGTTFDILAADTLVNTAVVTGPAGSFFAASTVLGGDGRQLLRLTAIPEPGSIMLLATAALTLAFRRTRRIGVTVSARQVPSSCGPSHPRLPQIIEGVEAL